MHRLVIIGFAAVLQFHLVGVQLSAQDTITTVAGNGVAGFSGDGGAGTGASIDDPSGLATDTAGNLYIADTDNHRIRKVSPGGVITTVAGNGVEAFAGDGGPATTASLAYPSGVTVDSTGNLYIGDTGNNRIRKVSASGMISTIAGNGIAAFSGDGGFATSASLDDPRGVAMDAAGSLYIADNRNHRIRKVSPGGVISTVAAGLLFPNGVTLDAAGNLYIADTENQQIL